MSEPLGHSEWRMMADAIWELAKMVRNEELKQQMRAFVQLLHAEASKRERDLRRQ